MKYPNLKYCLLVASLAVTLGLGGCSEEEELYPLPKNEEQTTENTKLILSLNTPAVSRSVATEMDGTTAENSYNSLTLYITNTSDVIEKAITFSDIASQKNIVVVMDDKGVDLDTPKHIYLVANANGDPLTGNIRDAIGTIKDISDVATNNNFLMVGQAEKENNKEITFEKGKYISASVELTRVTSKVLLTTEINGNGFVKNVEDGFIRKENLRYVLQTTNSRFYYLPKASQEDPNYTMSDLIAKTGSSFGYIAGKEYEFLNRELWNTNVSSGEEVTPYDAKRMEEGSSNPYVEGVYCLENTTSGIGSLDMNKAEMISAPQMVTTYLRIAAKLIPNKIDEITYTDGKNAEKALAGNKGTFYTYRNAKEEDKKICYSTIAKAQNILGAKGYTDLSKENFKEHTGGWVYFNAYVNGKTFDATKSSLIRNNYYICNITKIVAPLVEQTIEITTTVKDWVNRGKTNVDIPVTEGENKQ